MFLVKSHAGNKTTLVIIRMWSSVELHSFFFLLQQRKLAHESYVKISLTEEEVVMVQYPVETLNSANVTRQLITCSCAPA